VLFWKTTIRCHWVDCAADVSDRFCDVPGHRDLVHWLLCHTHRCVVHRPCTPVCVPCIIMIIIMSADISNDFCECSGSLIFIPLFLSIFLLYRSACDLLYRVRQKSQLQIFVHIFARYWEIFSIFFTNTFCGKLVIKWLLNNKYTTAP